MDRQEWNAVKQRLGSKLTEEERRMLDLLVSGKSTVEVGRELGQHRSMVWRKLQRIKRRDAGRSEVPPIERDHSGAG